MVISQNLLSLEEQKTSSLSLSELDSQFCRQEIPVLTHDKIKPFLLEEDLFFLNNVFFSLSPSTKSLKKAVLFYPGSGHDLILPLLCLERIYPQTKDYILIFVDIIDYYGLLKTILADLSLPFSSKKSFFTFFSSSQDLFFYWNSHKVHLRFIKGDALKIIRKFRYHLYFERAFSLYLHKHPVKAQEKFAYFRTKNIEPNGTTIINLKTVD
jgi:hypothetical protein